MDLIDQLKVLAERINTIKDSLETEEATKTSMVLPFLQLLGYDVFNPMEVTPELTADIGLKKGEKVDYAVLKDGEPIIIMECKRWKDDLSLHNSQLHRYFHVTKTRFAILTNGIQYKFYTDLDAINIMDNRPFLEIDLMDISEGEVNELKKFHKNHFDIDNILSTASELKYTKAFQAILNEELKNPSDTFMRFIVGKAYDGRYTAKVQEQFRPILKRSIQLLINERINEKLQFAMKSETSDTQEPTDTHDDLMDENVVGVTKSGAVVETTEEELEAFMIVKAILRQHVESSRIAHRDTVNYMGILLDDNNRQPVCRLWLNRQQKYLGIFDQERKEKKVPIKSIDSIFEHSEAIVSALNLYVDTSDKIKQTV